MLFLSTILVSLLSLGLPSGVSIAPENLQNTGVSEGLPADVRGHQAQDENSERCHWQTEVKRLSTLQQNKNATLQTEVPCEEESEATIPAATTEPVHSDTELASTIRTLTAGYPLEVMTPAIAEYDRAVAGLIVGIAKKESNWGKRVPRDGSGADCFNYWGYKGAGSRGVAMGHGCFGTPEEAVRVVGERLETLVALRQTSAPANMIVWKCGSSCAGHSPESVKKWIADVSLYYDRIALR